jgi:hypothetical protein
MLSFDISAIMLTIAVGQGVGDLPSDVLARAGESVKEVLPEVVERPRAIVHEAVLSMTVTEPCRSPDSRSLSGADHHEVDIDVQPGR